LKSDLARRIREVCYLEGNFTLSSGKKSNYYLDKYLFTTQPYLLEKIIKKMVPLISPETDKLAGTELGAIPIVTALSLQTKIPFVIIRKKGKEYGTGKKIEGELNSWDKVTLIEDVLTTGRQTLRGAEILEKEKAIVIEIIAVIDREEGARKKITEKGYKLKVLFTKRELGI